MEGVCAGTLWPQESPLNSYNFRIGLVAQVNVNPLSFSCFSLRFSISSRDRLFEKDSDCGYKGAGRHISMTAQYRTEMSPNLTTPCCYHVPEDSKKQLSRLVVCAIFYS